MSEKICSHHIGGRGGNRSFPILNSFESDFVNILYDADNSCLEQIANLNKYNTSEFRVIPACVGGKNGHAKFNINYDPSTSSLRAINPKTASWYFYFRKYQYDYISKETCQPVKKLRVKVITLDTLLKDDHTLVPPDILSIDTQGTEYEILEGGVETLKEDTLAVIAEVWFHEIYKGQKLFGDVSALLHTHGFVFVKFTKDFFDFSPYRYPIGLRGDGLQSSTDALFLKGIDVVKRVRDLSKRFIMLEKLAFIALTFNQFEFALECMRESSKLKAKKGVPQYVYQDFLRKFFDLSKRVPKKYPPTFMEKFTSSESSARFHKDTKIKHVGLHGYGLDVVNTIPDSDIEKLFRKFNLSSQADLLKLRRCQGMSALGSGHGVIIK